MTELERSGVDADASAPRIADHVPSTPQSEAWSDWMRLARSWLRHAGWWRSEKASAVRGASILAERTGVDRSDVLAILRGDREASPVETAALLKVLRPDHPGSVYVRPLAVARRWSEAELRAAWGDR